jgi:hypothetical protein
METPVYNTYESVLDIVRTWTPEQRFLLVKDVMKTLEITFHSGQLRRQTAEEALGLLTTNQAPPSDVEVQQWLEAHRMEKYG